MSESATVAGSLRFRCVRCTQLWSAGPFFAGCPRCGGALFFDVSVEAIRAAYDRAAGAQSLAAYSPVLPVARDAFVTLNEGGTPLLDQPKLARELGLSRLWIKHEGVNPTGSFKDRLCAVAVSAARMLGCSRIACTSTGNHGASLAAYAAVGALQALVLLPDAAPRRAAYEVERYGATALIAGWDACGPAVEELVRRGWAYSGRNWPRPLANPYGIEGYKTIAYEIVQQLRGARVDVVAMPCGGGDGIYGMWRGFCELRRAGVIDWLPAMVACQPEASCSIARGLESGASEVPSVPRVPSVALSLTTERGGDHGLWALRESGGHAVAVAEHELARAVRDCGASGLFAEPAGAAGLAGLRRLAAARDLLAAKSAVIVLTGGGGRWPAAVADLPGGRPYGGDPAELPN